MSQYPQKQSKLEKLARMFDDQPESRQKMLGMIGLGYGALVFFLMATGIAEGFLAFVLFLSLPGAALLSWAAFRNESVAPDVSRMLGDSNAQRRVGRVGSGSENTLKPGAEALRTEPLAEREKHLATPPVQILDRRADEIRKILQSRPTPATVGDLAAMTKWTEEAVVSGLARLQDLGELREEFPDTHDMHWRYELTSGTEIDDFDRRLRESSNPVTRSDVSARSGGTSDSDIDDVSAESEYAMDASVDTLDERK